MAPSSARCRSRCSGATVEARRGRSPPGAAAREAPYAGGRARRTIGPTESAFSGRHGRLPRSSGLPGGRERLEGEPGPSGRAWDFDDDDLVLGRIGDVEPAPARLEG